MPCNNSSNSDWAFMGNSKNDAQKKAMEYINNNRMNGFSVILVKKSVKSKW